MNLYWGPHEETWRRFDMCWWPCEKCFSAPGLLFGMQKSKYFTKEGQIFWFSNDLRQIITK